MNVRTAQMLNALNKRFYREQAASFSETRQHAWAGWQRLAQEILQQWGIDDARITGNAPLRVLDVACGNLRFERFLQEAFPQADIRAVGVDSCVDLLPDSANGDEPIDACTIGDSHLAFLEQDIVAALIEGRPFLPDGYNNSFDLVVSFGFFHHVPSGEARQMLLDVLGGSVSPGGIVCISLWRFMDDDAFARKARAAHDEALSRLPELGFSPALENPLSECELEQGDMLLGWQGKPNAFRYCHSFSDGEVQRLIQTAQSLDLSLSAGYRADGSTDAMNEYLVFKK